MSKSSLRPQLSLIEATNPIEKFQNEVIRPILKLQNDLILNLFYTYLENLRIKLPSNHDELLPKLKSILQKDKTIKNQLIGIVIGLFETDEINIYSEYQKENNKRIIQMITQRLFDNLI